MGFFSVHGARSTMRKKRKNMSRTLRRRWWELSPPLFIRRVNPPSAESDLIRYELEAGHIYSYHRVRAWNSSGGSEWPCSCDSPAT